MVLTLTTAALLVPWKGKSMSAELLVLKEGELDPIVRVMAFKSIGTSLDNETPKQWPVP